MPINLFDANFYRSANSDLNGLSDSQAWFHFKNYGLEHGLKFSSLVDLDFYRASNSDIANLNNIQAYEHLANYGISQGRKFSSLVDLNFYQESNTHLADLNYEELFKDLKNRGIASGDSFSPFFSVNYYLDNNPELQNSVLTYRDAYEHFVTEGLNNGLDASGFIESDYAGNSLDSARAVTLDSGEIIFRDSIGKSDTDDFYSLSLNNPNSNLEISVKGLSADVDVELLNNSGEIIFNAASNNINESLNINNLKAGEYYIRVFEVIEAPCTNYDLSLSVIPIDTESDTVVLNESPPLSAVPSSPVPQSIPVDPILNPLIEEVVTLTNFYRSQYDLQPLTLNIDLSESAQLHSEDMALSDFFSHTGSNGSKVSDRTELAGYESSYVGENIAAGHITAEEVVRGWMNSPGHRENILNANYTEIGVGYHYLANDTGEINYNTYWTQDFGAVI
jgi:uncharacterized protein YkwD